MLRLNLLSKESKKEVKLKKLYSVISRVDFLLIIGFIFLAVVFKASSTILESSFYEFSNPGSLLRTSGREYNEKIKNINNKLKTINKIQEDFIPSSLLIKELTDRIPDGVSLSYIKADINNKSLKIMGRAQKREDFLKLRDNLSSSEVFKEVDSPLQNIMQRENIDFEIMIELDTPKLK